MSKNEEYVRGMWKDPGWFCDDPRLVPNRYGILLRFGLSVTYFASEDEAWAAAAEFTREREEEIRQIEEEIEFLENSLEIFEDPDDGLIKYESYWDMLFDLGGGGNNTAFDALDRDATIEIIRQYRILAREQAALQELRRGMK